MLAPLKDRAILEREPGGNEDATPAVDIHTRLAGLEEENTELKLALHRARQRCKDDALLNTCKEVELRNEVGELRERCRQLEQKIGEFESGQAMTDMAIRLMQLSEANEHLINAAQQVWYLDKTICAAHQEYARLARERDELAARLHRSAIRFID